MKKDVFDVNKADLSGITDSGGEYINKALHKAKIELTQDGIKAAAATMMGRAGADGRLFDYIYEVPIDEIDLTFDKPFMFLIRDTVSGEVWFAGTVYDPLKWNEDLTREEYAYFDQENPPTLH
jgi:serpin B